MAAKVKSAPANAHLLQRLRPEHKGVVEFVGVRHAWCSWAPSAAAALPCWATPGRRQGVREAAESEQAGEAVGGGSEHVGCCCMVRRLPLQPALLQLAMGRWLCGQRLAPLGSNQAGLLGLLRQSNGTMVAGRY